MFDALRALRTSPLPHRDRVRRALELCVDHEFAEPDIGMFFSTAATEEGGRLDRLQERIVRPYHDAMFPLLADAVEAGTIRPVDPNVLFFMIASAIGTTVSYSHMMLEFTSLPTRPEAFRQAVLGVAFNLIGDRAPRATRAVTSRRPARVRAPRCARSRAARRRAATACGTRAPVRMRAGCPHPSVRRT